MSLQKSWRKRGKRPVLDLFFFKKKRRKSFTSGKSKWSSAKFQYISIALKLAYNKSELYKNLGYWSRDMLKFDFQGKVLAMLLHDILCTIFQGKCISCCILLTDQISLLDWLYFLRYWAICVLQLFFLRLWRHKPWN